MGDDPGVSAFPGATTCSTRPVCTTPAKSILAYQGNGDGPVSMLGVTCVLSETLCCSCRQNPFASQVCCALRKIMGVERFARAPAGRALAPPE
uniref:Uncharacterized protein n=1 Tax=Zea mays TaxID=4577 RepID=A0A804NF89_MAIZE